MQSAVGLASPTPPVRNSRPPRTEPSAFRLYFNDLSTTKRLSPQEEISAALELRRLRRRLWETLLEEPSLRPAVVTAAASVLAPKAIPPLDSIAALARALAEADRDLRAACASREAVYEHAEPGTGPRKRCDEAFAELERARNAFVSANLGLVVVVARRYAHRGGLDILDAVQEGNAGLIKAVDRFDPQRGVRFSTYAIWWIRHSIGRALADRGTEIRVPAHLVERRQLLARTRAELERKHGRAPTTDELAEAVGLSRRKVDRALGASWEPARTFDVSTGRSCPLDVEGLPASTKEPGRRLDDGTVTAAIHDLVETLPDMQRDVLLRRFGFDGGTGMTLREIGQVHGLSRERIRQLQNRALHTLRRHLRERGIGQEIVLDD
jgi:RNA polymerase primary sigma factor